MPTLRMYVASLFQTIAIALAVYTGSSLCPKLSFEARFLFAPWWSLLVIGNGLGIFILLIDLFNKDEGLMSGGGMSIYRSHVFTCWAALVFTYPLVVIQFWNIYYPGYLAHIQYTLAAVPIGLLILRQPKLTIFVTTATIITALASHVYICLLAQNQYGIYSALAIALTFIMMSIPTERTILKVSSREVYLIGFSVATFILYKAIQTLIANPVKVTLGLPSFYK